MIWFSPSFFEVAKLGMCVMVLLVVWAQAIKMPLPSCLHFLSCVCMYEVVVRSL